MYPVLAPDVIQTMEMERRQLLAQAERERLIKSAAIASGTPRRSATTLRRVRDGLAGAIVAVTRFRGVPSAQLGGESAPIRSA